MLVGVRDSFRTQPLQSTAISLFVIDVVLTLIMVAISGSRFLGNESGGLCNWKWVLISGIVFNALATMVAVYFQYQISGKPRNDSNRREMPMEEMMRRVPPDRAVSKSVNIERSEPTELENSLREIERLKEEGRKREAELTEGTEELEKRGKRIQELEETVSQDRTVIDQLVGVKAQIDGQVDNCDLPMLGLVQALANANDELTAAQREINLLRARLATTDEALSKSVDKFLRAEGDIKELEALNAEKDSSLKRIYSEGQGPSADDYNNAIRQQQETNDRLREEIDRLREENELYKQGNSV